eukprot:scaffold26960_cov22-Cyclotella_meneghiniana.AAC.2
MKHSFHRDDYGYEYLKSRGDNSIKETDETDWNVYTTGPWSREQALRNGFNRYDRQSTNAWVQSNRGRNERYGYSSPNDRRPHNPYWDDGRQPQQQPNGPYRLHSERDDNNQHGAGWNHNSPHSQHGDNNRTQHHGAGGYQNSPYSTPPRPPLSSR